VSITEIWQKNEWARGLLIAKDRRGIARGTCGDGKIEEGNA
jgi:hypothetical protein